MTPPAALVARHPVLPGRSSTAWALELLPLLYAGTTKQRHPFQRRRRPLSFSPDIIEALQRLHIGARAESYGRNLRRFEKELAGGPAGAARHPLVCIPSMAHIDWRDGSLHILARTFVVTYEDGDPVLLSREPGSRTIMKISMKQLRFLHKTWSHWPAMMPSMLLTVLWHWPLAD